MPLRFLTSGESHGPELTAILEGLPSGLPIDRAELDIFLARRQAGLGASGRMKIERDVARITGGVMAGLTTGAPLAMRIANRDYAAWAERDIAPMTVPRPGHGDLTASLKYGYSDLRLALERASARETAARAAVGGVCAQLLAALGVRVGSYVEAIGGVEADLGAMSLSERLDGAEDSPVRCPDPDAARAMAAAIEQAARDRDTLGGVFVVVALGVPQGLGSHVHWDRRLTGRLVAAMCSIPAVKGAEIGPAFASSRMRGTEVHGGLEAENGLIRRIEDMTGGLEAGITTGEPVVIRCAMKPISTTLTPRPSVDLATGEPAEARYERSDICAVPRAAVVGEAMAAFVLADAMLEKLGGDTLAELQARLALLPTSRAESFDLANAPWRFGYDSDPESEP